MLLSRPHNCVSGAAARREHTGKRRECVRASCSCYQRSPGRRRGIRPISPRRRHGAVCVGQDRVGFRLCLLAHMLHRLSNASALIVSSHDNVLQGARGQGNDARISLWRHTLCHGHYLVRCSLETGGTRSKKVSHGFPSECVGSLNW